MKAKIDAIMNDRALIRALTDDQLEILRSTLGRHLVGDTATLATEPSEGKTGAAAPAESPRTVPHLPVKDHYIAYIDGACSGNPGPGGWGVAFLTDETPGFERYLEISGGAESTTNNRMEIQAAIEALRSVPEPENGTTISVELRTDSQLVIGTMTQNWRTNTNQDLWAELKVEAAKRTVIWTKVKGHSGNKGNDLADRLATAEAQKRRLAA